MVIDGNSIINRAFYGVRGLTTGDGTHTNAVYGFLTIYFKLIEELKPDNVCVAFDLSAPTFRHIEYDGYKAKRKGMPEELASQMPIIKRVLDAMNVTRFELEGFEADDILGTISKKCSSNRDECIIVTGDRDSLQLINNPGTNVFLVTTVGGKTDTVRYDAEKLVEKYGVMPDKLINIKGLMGDASDNIPGVAGIGEKTASQLIKSFGSIEEIYENIDTLDIKETVRNKLKNGKESAFLSKKLATIELNVPIDFCAAEGGLKEFDRAALFEIFKELEFHSLIKRLNLTDDAPIQRAEYKYTEIKTKSQLDALTEKLRRVSNASVVLSPRHEAIGVDLGDEGYAICANSLLYAEYDEFLKILFSDEVKKTAHDIKSLMVALSRDGIKVDGFIFDTALGAYVLDPTKRSFSLADVSNDFCPDIPVSEDKFCTEGAFTQLTGCDEALSAISDAARAVGIMREDMGEKLRALGMDKLYFDIELPLCRVLADMQLVGLKADRQGLVEMGRDMHSRMESIAEKVFEIAGYEFNILSPKQIGELLFEKLSLPVVKKTKTGYSTDIEVLEKLRDKHEIIEFLIDYRKYSKLKSTYADGMIKEISEKDGRIHSNFKQMVTSTGRISSTEPNLQNIPIRDELGEEVRKLFISEDSEWTLIDADYSQIELRVLAHIANDEAMIDAFVTGQDIHTTTASRVFGVPTEQVDSSMRRAAKAVNFGIVYGISDFSLAGDLNIPVYEAKRYIESYLEKYSGVRAYMHDIVEKAKRDGYVTTLFGRRRELPELQSKNYNIRSFGERVALNTPIQGTAADIIKIAMLNIYNRLKKEGLSSRLVLQVHDELIVEAWRDEAVYVKGLLTDEMEGACKLSVPLIAEASVGDTWYDAKA